DKRAGYYSVRQEQFLTDKERGPNGEFGPEWGEVEFREEENYYFKLSQHKEWLLRYLDSRNDAVIPDFRQKELRNAVEKLSGDLCISRPKSRLDWGIELPFDKDFVTYVWFDALTNYISFAGYDPCQSNIKHQPSNFLDKWPALQIIGKDILIPAHGIYWLIMLHAIGFPDDQMPQLLVHGWWNLGGAKMSKSAGNIIDPFVFTDKYGAEALRLYLMNDITIGRDSEFAEDRLVMHHDIYLANSFGNLLNRTLNMIQKYREGRLTPSIDFRKSVAIHEQGLEAESVEMNGVANQASVAGRQVILYRDNFDLFAANYALQNAIEIAVCGNSLVEVSSPWKLAKDMSDESRCTLDAVLYALAESLRIIAILISPVLPKAAHGIFDQLNWKMELSGKEERFSLADAEWGKLPDGHVVGKPVPLFPRIELNA
ncbi:MAG: methionine--tRNA ligase, partial [Verrucomicrobia bacterium]